MTDTQALIERLKVPTDADGLYDAIIAQRKQTSSDLPRMNLANTLEFIDEERAEAAVELTRLTTALTEADAKLAKAREALGLWVDYDDQDEAGFSGVGPMLLYAKAINAARACLAELETRP